LKERIGETLRVTAGADANALLDRQGTAPLRADQVGGAYADASFRPTDRVELVAGTRVDAYRFSGTLTPSVDPRLALRVRVLPGVTALTSVGVAHQPPTSLLPAPGLVLDPSSGLQTAYQYATGAELRLPWALTARVTGFYNADRNMNDFVQDCGSFTTICGLVARADGSSYGLEVNLQRAFSQRFAGWISYTLSRTERNIGAVPFLSPFDRTHVLSAVARYDFGRGIDVGVRATFYTGRPDIPSFTLNDVTLPLALGAASIPQHRLPDFYRIDVRAEKRWTFGARKWLALVLEFFDATLNSEAVDFQCSIDQGVCAAQKVGPLALPSIGVEAGF
jgi:outer membrane receptor protein involved in Fe transport